MPRVARSERMLLIPTQPSVRAFGSPSRSCARWRRPLSNAFDGAGHLTQNEPIELHLSARIVDIDPNEIAKCVIVEHDAFRDFLTIDTRLLRQIYVQRVGIGEVIESHG